jgi:hypothetical protein
MSIIIQDVPVYKVPNGICNGLRELEQEWLAELFVPIVENGIPGYEPSACLGVGSWRQHCIRSHGHGELTFDKQAVSMPPPYNNAGNKFLWIIIDPKILPDWTIDVRYNSFDNTFHGLPMYKDWHYILDEIGFRAGGYTLIYKQCGVEMFNIHIDKFISACWPTASIRIELCKPAIDELNDTKPACSSSM